VVKAFLTQSAQRKTKINKKIGVLAFLCVLCVRKGFYHYAGQGENAEACSTAGKCLNKKLGVLGFPLR
jgi:hypothetical protein